LRDETYNQICYSAYRYNHIRSTNDHRVDRSARLRRTRALVLLLATARSRPFGFVLKGFVEVFGDEADFVKGRIEGDRARREG
jgi:hypothetical protein